MKLTIADWARTAGLTVDDLPTQLSVLSSEVIETMQGLNLRHRYLVIDGLVDVHWMVQVAKALTDGAMDLTSQLQDLFDEVDDIFPFLISKHFQNGQHVVMEANFSKFCKTVEEAEATLKAYREIKVDVHYKRVGDLYVIRSSFNQIGIDGKTYSKDKILKSINFIEPRFIGIPDSSFSQAVQEGYGGSASMYDKAVAKHGFCG